MSTIAFFDVDETLISVKSMFHFLDYFLRERGEPPSTYARLSGELRQMARSGAPRQDVNRHYYTYYRGQTARDLSELGQRWFDDECTTRFHHQTLDVLDQHRTRGADIVLVSGSFFACLDPVVDAVGAVAAWGSRPRIRRGELTGEVVVPMIGTMKRHAVEMTAAASGARPADCYAYGDHISDLPMLRAVGHPTAVGPDPDLNAHATRHGWPHLDLSLAASAHVKDLS